VLVRLFQPGQNLAPDRIGQCFVDRIDVHVGSLGSGISGFFEPNIAILRYKKKAC
jgi:hypothetical protein